LVGGVKRDVGERPVTKVEAKVAVVVAPVYVNGVGIIREMARKGAHVVAVDTYSASPGLHSRLAGEKIVVVPPEDNPGSFAQYLIGRRDLYGALVIPTDDYFVREIHNHRDILEEHFRLCVSPGNAVPIALDKALTAAAAVEAGVDTPRTAEVRSESELDGAAAFTGFPALVKPVLSTEFNKKFGRKAFVVKDAAELRDAFAQSAAAGERVVIQEVIPGGDEDMAVVSSYWDSEGKCVGECSYRKTLQYPPHFGVGQLCRAADIPEARALSRKMLEYMGYRGAVAAPEFKYDRRDGKLKLIEVNVRTPMQTALFRRAGCDLLDMMWRDKLGLPQIRAGKMRQGLGWAHEKNALMRHRAYPEDRPTLREYLRLYRPPVIPALWSISDPGPFFADVWPVVRRRFRSGRRPEA
jgi:predicted ATP-grasp superfamily ATP-dependent carboligase